MKPAGDPALPPWTLATASGFPPPPRKAAAIRDWDRRAVEEYGMASVVLMENAGRGAASIILGLAACAALKEPFAVFCGPGNNGGDGFVVARYLEAAGREVCVFLLKGIVHAADSDAGRNLQTLRRLGTPLVELSPERIPAGIKAALPAGTIVDALFGTGLSRPLNPPYLPWVDAVNESRRDVVSLDIPSGLAADTGRVLGAAVHAAHTITFAASKVGFSLGEGPACCGQVHVLDIGIPPALWRPSEPAG